MPAAATKSKPKLSQVAKAYERHKVARDALYALDARSMECTEDKAGIVWERWLLPNGRNVVTFATPTWWDILGSIDELGSTSSAATLDALAVLAAKRAHSVIREAPPVQSPEEPAAAALRRIAEMTDRDGNPIEMHRDELRGIARAALAALK